MPKIVDHAARREELAHAVWRVIGHSGITGATVRAVAAESGWSMGAVRHYFSTHDDLLHFAVQVMSERVAARVQALYADAAGPSGRLDRPCAALEEMVPLDDDRMVEVLVWLGFMTRARTDATFDDIRQAGWHGERHICRLAVADAAGRPLPKTMDARLSAALERAVDRIHLGLDGLTVQAATYPEHWPADAQRTALRRLVREALPSQG